jgi:hypothetical protein
MRIQKQIHYRIYSTKSFNEASKSSAILNFPLAHPNTGFFVKTQVLKNEKIPFTEQMIISSSVPTLAPHA